VLEFLLSHRTIGPVELAKAATGKQKNDDAASQRARSQVGRVFLRKQDIVWVGNLIVNSLKSEFIKKSESPARSEYDRSKAERDMAKFYVKLFEQSQLLDPAEAHDAAFFSMDLFYCGVGGNFSPI
jgi:hypothetical protein